MRFKTKILLVLIIAATFPVSVAGFLSIRTYQREMTERIEIFNNRSAALAVSGIRDFLSGSLRSLLLSSHVIPFEQFPAADLSDALKIPYRQFDYINAVALFDQDANQLSEPAFEKDPKNLKGLEGHEPVTLEDLRVFAAAIPFDKALSDGWAFGPAYYSFRTGIPRVALAVSFPVQGGAARWVLATEISLKHLLDKIKDLTPSARGTAFIVDNEGKVVCHNEEKMMADRVSLGHLEIVVDGKKNTKKTFTRNYSDTDGTQMAGAYSPIDLTDWGLVVAQPVDEAFAAVNRARRTTMFWVALGLVVAVAGGVLLASGVTAPVRELAKGANLIAGGDFNWQINATGGDEIGQLARAFNHMSAELKRSFETISEKNNEIAKWNEELKQRVKNRTRELRMAEEQIIISQKTAVVTELSAGIAHQINNPLTSIMGFSQLMLSQTDKDYKFNRYFTSIVNGAKRIQTLVDDLLRFSRTSENSSFTNVDLNQLLDNTLSMMRRQLKEKNIQTDTRFASNLPLANGDPVELQQAIVHILQNAKNAMPEGGKINVGTEPMDGGAIKVFIEDTGVGIPEEDLTKIFDLFYTTNHGSPKKGVGLSVADRIIRDHKGRINVTSKVGVGSMFTIFLPGVQKATHLG